MRILVSLIFAACIGCVDTGTLTLDPAPHQDEPAGVVDPPVTTPGEDVAAPAPLVADDMADLGCVPHSDSYGDYTEWRVVVRVPDLDTDYAPDGYDALAVVADVYMPAGFDGASAPCWTGQHTNPDPSYAVTDPGDVGVVYLPRVAVTCRDENLVGVPYAEARVLDTKGEWVTFAVSDAKPPTGPLCELPDRYETI